MGAEISSVPEEEYVMINGQNFDINYRDELGDDVLGIAVAHCDIDAVRNLISKGFNIDVKNNDGNTPLHLAVMCNNLEIMKFLIKNGAEVNAQNNTGDTPLSIAMIENNTAAIQILGPDADPTIQNQEGLNSFCIALWEQKYDLIKTIIIVQGINNVIKMVDPLGTLEFEGRLMDERYNLKYSDFVDINTLKLLAKGCSRGIVEEYGEEVKEGILSAIRRSIFFMNPLNYME